MSEKEKRGRIIKMEGIKELPITSTSFGMMDWNETGNWRYLRPVYRVKTAPCTLECPAGEIIPRYMFNAADGEHEEAWKVLVRDNPFPATCGRLCDHPCESICLRRDFDETVGIRDVERFLGDMAIGNWSLKPPKVSREERVAIIGAGPTGLSCAYRLAQYGYRVTLYEEGMDLGGSLRKDVPESLLPPRILDGEIDNIISLGIDVRKGTRVTDGDMLAEMMKEFKAIFLAVGNQLSEGGKASIPFDGVIDHDGGKVALNENDRTSVDSIFAGGSVVTGDRMGVAEAIGWGGRGAKAIDIFIKDRPAPRAGKEKEIVAAENLNLDHFVRRERNLPRTSGNGGESQEQAAQTFDEDVAKAEAARCFMCGICVFCDNCLIFCPDVAVERLARGYKIDYYHCKGCGICVRECPRDAMSMESELKWKK